MSARVVCLVLAVYGRATDNCHASGVLFGWRFPMWLAEKQADCADASPGKGMARHSIWQLEEPHISAHCLGGQDRVGKRATDLSQRKWMAQARYGISKTLYILVRVATLTVFTMAY